MNSKQRRRYVRKHLPELKVGIATAKMLGLLEIPGERWFNQLLQNPGVLDIRHAQRFVQLVVEGTDA